LWQYFSPLQKKPDESIPAPTLDRLVELSQEVDFAAFVFAQDDWTGLGEAGAR
jgi:hypothetical protein